MDITLEKSPDGRPFVWVVVLGQGEESQLLAMSDQRDGRSFIAAFASKEDGLVGLGRLTQLGAPSSGELQAVALEDLAEQAQARQAGILILNRDGEIMGEIESRPIQTN